MPCGAQKSPGVSMYISFGITIPDAGVMCKDQNLKVDALVDCSTIVHSVLSEQS